MPKLQKVLIPLALVLLIQFLIFNFQFSIAQTQSGLDKAQNDYTFQFTKYREAQNKYITARASYLTFKTATAKNDAYLATGDYLVQIDSLYLAYLFLVNENGNSLSWQNTDNPKEKLNQIIEGELAFFDGNQKKVKDAKTLEQLTDLASELRNHRDKEFSLKINKILATLELTEAESAFGDFNQLAEILDKTVSSKIQAGETKSILSNWTTEIADIKNKTQNYQTKAKEMFGKTKEQTATDGEIKDISRFAKLAKNELLRSKSLFKEVIGIL